jgi:molybdate-binding protein
MHLGPSDAPGDGNAAAVRDRLGPGFRLLRVARWQEGLCLAPGLGLSTVRSALAPGLRWIGREQGSGARQCLDELLGDRRKPPRRIATDHRGVVEAVRHGWADLGVCVRLPAEESGLDFLDVRRESYDLCFPSALESDPRIQALIAAVRSPAYRRAVAALPGYDPVEAGELIL